MDGLKYKIEIVAHGSRFGWRVLEAAKGTELARGSRDTVAQAEGAAKDWVFDHHGETTGLKLP